MRIEEIIMADRRKKGLDPHHALRRVHRRMGKQKSSVLHENNTVVTAHRIGPGIAEVHLYTQDNPLTLARSITQMLHSAQLKGVKHLYSTTNNPSLVQFLQHVLSRSGMRVGRSDLPKYNLRIDL